MEKTNNAKNFSIAALICGIVGIIGGWIPVVQYFTLVIAILGIVFGVIGKKKSKEAGEATGLATAGLVLGIIGTALCLIMVICTICALAAVGTLAAKSPELQNALNSLS